MSENNRLSLVSQFQESGKIGAKEQIADKKIFSQAHFDTLWLKNPEKFDPNHTGYGKERIKRIVDLIKNRLDLSDKEIVDLGCGNGTLTRMLVQGNNRVTGVDVSENALKNFRIKGCESITLIRDYIPRSLLPDDHYDLVVAADLIAHIDSKEYRLFMSEIARIVKSDGFVVLSTSIDIESENALQKFIGLVSTEFDILDAVESHHFLLIKFLNFFKAPEKFVKGEQNPAYRKQALEKRFSFGKVWYKINSSRPGAFFWSLITPLTKYPVRLLERNRGLMLFLEKCSKFLYDERGVSHIIILGKRRPLFIPVPETQRPEEMKHKKMLWE